jgi:hypothetical protein
MAPNILSNDLKLLTPVEKRKQRETFLCSRLVFTRPLGYYKLFLRNGVIFLYVLINAPFRLRVEHGTLIPWAVRPTRQLGDLNHVLRAVTQHRAPPGKWLRPSRARIFNGLKNLAGRLAIPRLPHGDIALLVFGSEGDLNRTGRALFNKRAFGEATIRRS